MSSGTSISLAPRRAMMPEKIRQMPGNEFIMFWDGLPGRFIQAYRKPYWAMDECKGKYSDDPYHPTKAGPVAGT